MSTKEDDYFSGTSLDVAGQQSSNPPATGGTASGSQQSNNTKPPGKVNAGNGNGKSPASANRNRTKPKEGTAQTVFQILYPLYSLLTIYNSCLAFSSLKLS
jgi:hypothetical protein